jgi:hypothetical protein
MASIEKIITAPVRPWFEPVADAPLNVQAEVIRDQIAVSANTSEMVMRGTGLNITNLQGKRVLDLASGLSTFVLDARQHGIEAYGVDTGYATIDGLKERGEEHDERGYYTLVGDTSAFKTSNLSQVTGIIDFLNEGGPRNACLQDLVGNPSRYVTGSVLALPFTDKSFELLVCHSLLTSEPGLSAEFTEGTIMEAMRVLCRQGELRIGYLEKGSSLERFRTVEDNIRAAFEKAKAEKLAEKLSRISLGKDEWAYSITRSRKR